MGVCFWFVFCSSLKVFITHKNNNPTFQFFDSFLIFWSIHFNDLSRRSTSSCITSAWNFCSRVSDISKRCHNVAYFWAKYYSFDEDLFKKKERIKEEKSLSSPHFLGNALWLRNLCLIFHFKRVFINIRHASYSCFSESPFLHRKK